MKTLNPFLIIVILLFNVFVTFGQENPLSVIIEKYDASFKEKNQGVSLLIKKDGQTHTTSIGAHSLNEHSVFNIGSTTKTFTAILLLQEVEKGNLKLTDSIGTYLEPIANVDGELTIAQLLAHESGLDEVIGRNIQDIFYAKSDSLYQVDLLGQVEKPNPDMVGKFDYCNTNYFLLGKVIEKLTDQSYFDVLRERIIEPLQLENTYAYVHKNLPNLANPMHEGEDVTQFLDHRYFANVAFSAGSVASTLTDMETFFTALFETELLLKNESLELMLQSGNEVYGLGIFKPSNADDNYYGHGGNNIGYAFRNGYNRETKDLFLMFSNERKIPQKKVLRTDVLSILNGEAIADFTAVNIEKFKNYKGKYLLAEANLELEVLLEDGKMYLYVAAQNVKSELTQTSETTLLDTMVGASLSLIEGTTNSLTFEQNGFKTTIAKITQENATSGQE
ncbi:serine hydrolase domain-containing protein [uncultured Croceitalea sp.]|uniref:serine hydrolase domain-containing protein n=1 Tax=uncultured Croceitalea sp. TaxID=1798908 RepID=UPI0033058A3D